MNGWIKLHRKLLKNPIFYKPELLQLFVYCLLSAGHEEQRILWNGKEQIIPVGSFITGRKVLSKELGQTENKIRQNLELLEKMSIINRSSTNKFTLIKIVNYCSYQTMEPENHQQITNKSPTKRKNTQKNHQQNNPCEDGQGVLLADSDFSESPTNHQQNAGEGQKITTNKNTRKEYKDKDLKHMCDFSESPDCPKPPQELPNPFSPDFEEFWKHYPHFNRNKKGAYKNYLATLKGDSRLNKATPEQLLRAAKNYAKEVSGKEKQFVLHASTFLGPQERWFEYDKPITNSNGETLRDDVDKNDFLKGDGIEVDWKAYERARRGYDPYTPKCN